MRYALVAVLALCACEPKEIPAPTSGGTSVGVEGVIAQHDRSAERIAKANTRIADASAAMRKAIPTVQQSDAARALWPHVGTIDRSVDSISEAVLDLREASRTLAGRLKDIRAAEKALSDREAKVEARAAEAQEGVYRDMRIVVGLSMLCIVAAAFLGWFVSKSLGISLAALGLLGVVFGLGVIFYGRELGQYGAIVLGVLATAVVGAAVWAAMRGRKSDYEPEGVVALALAIRSLPPDALSTVETAIHASARADDTYRDALADAERKAKQDGNH